MHIDDGLVLGDVRPSHVKQDTEEVNAWMETLADSWQEAGFLVRDRTQAGQIEKYVGYSINACPALLCIPPEKAWDLRESLRVLTKSDQVCVRTLRSLLGIWIWAALLKRECLSIPSAVFGFVEKCADRVVPWWPKAREECVVMYQVLPAIVCELGAPISQWVFASDAQGSGEVADTDNGGYGVVASRPAVSVVKEAFLRSQSSGKTIVRLADNFTGRRDPSRELIPTLPSSAMPATLLNDSLLRWHPIDYGRWDFSDHITLGEGRAAVKISDLLSRRAECHGMKVLSLEDNIPCSGAFNKGRTSSPALNHICRRRCSYAVMTGIKQILPWVDSARMPADWLSRYHGAEPLPEVGGASDGAPEDGR